MKPSRIARAALASALLLGAARAEATPSGPRRWDVPDVSIAIDPSMMRLGDRAVEEVVAAAEVWQQASSAVPRMTFTVADGDDIGYFPGHENRNTVRFAKHGEPRAGGMLAITVVTADAKTRHILDADVIVNGDFRFCDALDERDRDGRRWSRDGESRYDLQSVLTHEFGHFVGLEDDLVDPDATMYLSTEPGDVRKRDLADTDRSALELNYAAGDEAAAGCSVTSGALPRGCFVGYVALLGAVALGLRGRRRLRAFGLGALAVAAPALFAAHAGASAVEPASEYVASAVVERATSRWQGGVIVTDVELAGHGAPELPSRLSTLGGRVGDVMQIVGHAPAPAPGDRLMLGLRRTKGGAELLYVRRAGS